jgi:hypothetical protein
VRLTGGGGGLSADVDGARSGGSIGGGSGGIAFLGGSGTYGRHLHRAQDMASQPLGDTGERPAPATVPLPRGLVLLATALVALGSTRAARKIMSRGMV